MLRSGVGRGASSLAGASRSNGTRPVESGLPRLHSLARPDSGLTEQGLGESGLDGARLGETGPLQLVVDALLHTGPTGDRRRTAVMVAVEEGVAAHATDGGCGHGLDECLVPLGDLSGLSASLNNAEPEGREVLMGVPFTERERGAAVCGPAHRHVTSVDAASLLQLFNSVARLCRASGSKLSRCGLRHRYWRCGTLLVAVGVTACDSTVPPAVLGRPGTNGGRPASRLQLVRLRKTAIEVNHRPSCSRTMCGYSV